LSCVGQRYFEESEGYEAEHDKLKFVGHLMEFENETAEFHRSNQSAKVEATAEFIARFQ
jgi:hypothetical protein